MIIREQVKIITDVTGDFTHRVCFDVELNEHNYIIFNIKPSHTEDGDEFYFSADKIKAVI